MDKITATLYLENNDDLASFKNLVEDIFTEKPERILVKGESRILNNGNELPFPNKKNQVTFEVITNHISISDISEEIYSYFESHTMELISFKKNVNIEGHIFIKIETDCKYIGEIFFNLKTINILSELGIEIVIGLIHND
jgi:hypothetical protein